MSPDITWPLVRNRIRRGLINHTFGMVRRNRDGSVRPHQGWDFEADIGEACLAIADGTVAARINGGDYGLQLILRFEFDLDRDGRKDVLFAAYCHLSRTDVSLGDTVKRGQQIGLTGDSGNARGLPAADRHLHFEIRTIPRPGRGLSGRISPLAVFGHCPIDRPVGSMAA